MSVLIHELHCTSRQGFGRGRHAFHAPRTPEIRAGKNPGPSCEKSPRKSRASGLAVPKTGCANISLGPTSQPKLLGPPRLYHVPPWHATPVLRGYWLSVQKAKQLWEAVLGDLQLRVSRPSFETWLRGTVGVGHSDGQFVVGTPNTFVAEMLDQRMYSLISQSLGRVVKGDVNVEFRVLSALPTPAGANHGTAQRRHRAGELRDRYTAPRPLRGDRSKLSVDAAAPLALI